MRIDIVENDSGGFIILVDGRRTRFISAFSDSTYILEKKQDLLNGKIRPDWENWSDSELLIERELQKAEAWDKMQHDIIAYMISKNKDISQFIKTRE